MKTDSESSLSAFIFSFLFLAVFFIIIIGCSFNATMISKGFYKLDFCLRSDCITFIENNMQGTIKLAQVLGWGLTLFTGFSAAYIALKTYVSGVKNSNITNHISHINMFRDFVKLEIDKRKRISPASIDIYYWYSSIFPSSKKGDLGFCLEYLNNIGEVGEVIKESNNEITSLSGDYIYKVHQMKIISSLSKIGVVLNRGPKNIFIEIEGEILELIDSVNSTFVSGHDSLCSIPRCYS
ncbi:retron Ec48 family effector membrane protein [Serratia marcescens]|uniref:retron Ec48 family effector membrane protein n=1 Tax=Serratia marcescens TaxID=615 RepID=UPI0024A763D1|nr:retron Ec48 family effector membrane protein [Serratia marcescens]